MPSKSHLEDLRSQGRGQLRRNRLHEKEIASPNHLVLEALVPQFELSVEGQLSPVLEETVGKEDHRGLGELPRKKGLKNVAHNCRVSVSDESDPNHFK